MASARPTVTHADAGLLPVVTIVGRPNVGKSTLFNALTGTRDALVADLPGVTRDRQYGVAHIEERPTVVVDTGGLVSDATGLDALTADQVRIAIEEAALVLFVVSARDGLTPEDEQVASMLRRHGKPVLLVANKTDGVDTDVALADFAALGMGEAIAVAAAHRRGLGALGEQVLPFLPEVPTPSEDDDDDVLRLAVLGRPNVGKSTLFNRLLGEERVMALDMPGTTRDAISARVERDGRELELIDTAGVRRRARVDDAVEKFSVIKALQAIERAHVVALMLDATEGLTDQDLKLLGHVLEQGRGLVIAVNKWDGLSADHRRRVRDELDRRLNFVTWARRIPISAREGSGLGELMSAVFEAYDSATRDMPTPELTRVLNDALAAHQPPVRQGYAARLRYAHAGGQLPPTIIIHGNRTNTIPKSYVRYLENTFIKHFGLRGTPLVLRFRSGDNPYKGRRNELSDRQKAKRQRLMRHRKRR